MSLEVHFMHRGPKTLEIWGGWGGTWVQSHSRGFVLGVPPKKFSRSEIASVAIFEPNFATTLTTTSSQHKFIPHLIVTGSGYQDRQNGGRGLQGAPYHKV